MQHKIIITTKVLRNVILICLFGGLIVAIDACKKNAPAQGATTDAVLTTVQPYEQNRQQTFVLTVASIQQNTTGASTVLFNRNEEVFRVQDAGILATLQSAFSAGAPVSVTVDPWAASVVQVTPATAQEAASLRNCAAAPISYAPVSIDLAHLSTDLIDNVNNKNLLAGMMPINSTGTESTLTSMIPDISTAQLMFNYITKQCCALAGPYAIDYCISFQYCEDGCYARAHKMCWIINNKFNYATQKVFSFANAGHDELCVKGEKWGGCCVNWWYHVAPLVTINTPTGPKAYVFDPAMFDQPVLLSSWLHAQENPACVPSGDIPHVSMINVQPTSSYSPSSYSGYSFDTDPYYASTDTTLVHYSVLSTCP